MPVAMVPFTNAYTSQSGMAAYVSGSNFQARIPTAIVRETEHSAYQLDFSTLRSALKRFEKVTNGNSRRS